MASRFQRVLLVEDDPALRRVIARNLERRGVHVRAVGSAEEADRALEEESPDVLILDIGLPGQTGWDLARALERRGIRLPIVILTGGPISRQRLEEFKPWAVLPKPFPLEALIRIIVGSEPGSSND